MTELLGVLVCIDKHIGWVTVEEVALGVILLDHFLVGEVINDVLNIGARLVIAPDIVWSGSIVVCNVH